MTNPNDPASPTYVPRYNAQHEVIAWVPHGGLTKREEFAKAAMQGLITANHGYSIGDRAVEAIRYADITLAELAKGET